MTPGEIARRVLDRHRAQLVYVDCLAWEGECVPMYCEGGISNRFRVATPTGPATLLLDTVNQILTEECKPWPDRTNG